MHHLLYFLILCFLFTSREGTTSALNSVDDYLDVVLHFKEEIPWELCTLIRVSVVETSDEVEIKLLNNPPIQSQTDSSDKQTISCFYQLTYQNNTSVLSVNNGLIIGYLMYKTNNYYADHIPILYQIHQSVRLFSKQESIKLSANVAQSIKSNSLNDGKSSAAGQQMKVVAPQVNLDYVNNTMDDYYLEVYLIADQAFSLKHGLNSRSYLFEVINYVNAVYRPIGIHILLVGFEVWSDYDRINITNDFNQILSNLQKWRSAMTQRHDSLHLITGNPDKNSVFTTALHTGICRWEFSLGIVADFDSSSSVTTAMLLARVIGINMGIAFDSSTCFCPDVACIMTKPFLFLNKLLPWSDCSLSSFYTNLKSGQSSYCLNNIPSVVITSTDIHQTCGNGIIDDGEDCDPGLADTNSQCCNKLTCKFATNAVCASGRCCNKATCQFLSAGVTCRRAKEECDLPEYCTGCSETCPDDIYNQNGLSCDNDLGTCYDGCCGSHNKECKLFYGPSSNKADDSCYQMNTVSIQSFLYGYCFSDFLYYANESYYYKLSPCSIENMLCGTLHCSGGSVAAWPTVTTLGYNYSFVNGLYSCQHIFISTNLTDLRNLGMVPNGARCGINKICQNSVCVPLNETLPISTPAAPTMPCSNMSNPILSSSTTPPSTPPSTTIVSSTITKPTICSQDYCKNGGTCYTGASNCNGDSICCLCTVDYLLPNCETRASRSMALSMTINEVYSDKHADVSSLEFKSVSKSVCDLLKNSIASFSTSSVICILSQIRKGSIITDVIIKSSSNAIKNITAIGTAMRNSCQNSQQSLCANLNFASLVENKSLYNVCPNGIPTSATTCSTNSYCTGDNTNAALYTCACKTEYRDSYNGINSDYQGRVCTEICIDSSCQNGGTCVEHTGNSSTCICPSSSSGKKCESLAGGGGGGDGNTTMIIIIVVVIVCVLGIAGGIVIGILCYKKKCCNKEKSKDIVYDTADPYYSSYSNNNNNTRPTDVYDNNTNDYADLDEINQVASSATNNEEMDKINQNPNHYENVQNSIQDVQTNENQCNS